MSAQQYPKSAEIFRRNRRHVMGGVVSVNRAVWPEIAFVRGEGAYIWDADGNRYIDYHAAFSPHLLGHNHPSVNRAIERALAEGLSLFGSGATRFEGELAALICQHAAWVQSIQFLNTGSEATCQALRVARAATGRDHIIVMQGGYNGWYNDVACNLMTPLGEVGPRVSPGEYPFIPISAGIPREHQRLVHAVNFNDLESVRWVAERYPIAALITEPVLQNVGVVLPEPGYLAGLRVLADEYGFVLIFDEVKTGFRHALGGYVEICGVVPDLVVYGKAIANGHPIAALGGKAALMELFVHPDPRKRVLLAGTYNAHPLPTVAAIATLERLLANDGEVYRHLERLGALLEQGVREMLRRKGVNATLARQGSAFCLYFMDHRPRDWHDLAAHHRFAVDEEMRQEMIHRGVYFFPLAAKQCSISAAHTESDLEFTLACLEKAMELDVPLAVPSN